MRDKVIEAMAIAMCQEDSHKMGEPYTGCACNKQCEMYAFSKSAYDAIEAMGCSVESNEAAARGVPELTLQELKAAERHCDWMAFKHAWNAVMNQRETSAKK